MHENGSAGLLVRAEPLGMAERVCKRMVNQVRVADGALELGVDCVYAGAVNTGLVKKGITVSELRSSGGSRCGVERPARGGEE
jgi:hypothetical protein